MEWKQSVNMMKMMQIAKQQAPRSNQSVSNAWSDLAVPWITCSMFHVYAVKLRVCIPSFKRSTGLTKYRSLQSLNPIQHLDVPIFGQCCNLSLFRRERCSPR